MSPAAPPPPSPAPSLELKGKKRGVMRLVRGGVGEEAKGGGWVAAKGDQTTEFKFQFPNKKKIFTEFVFLSDHCFRLEQKKHDIHFLLFINWTFFPTSVTWFEQMFTLGRFCQAIGQLFNTIWRYLQAVGPFWTFLLKRFAEFV